MSLLRYVILLKSGYPTSDRNSVLKVFYILKQNSNVYIFCLQLLPVHVNIDLARTK